MVITKRGVLHRYVLLKEYFQIDSSSWDMVHTPSPGTLPYVFCEENRKSLIAEYLVWEEFIEDAKKFEVPYYKGIDEFLKIFKPLVEKSLKV